MSAADLLIAFDHFRRRMIRTKEAEDRKKMESEGKYCLHSEQEIGVILRAAQLSQDISVLIN